MVQLTKADNFSPDSRSQIGAMAPVKLEIDDSLEEQYGPLSKRSKLSSSLQEHQQQLQNLEDSGFAIPPSQYNPLDEPSPLGLRLRKSPSLLDLIQMRLSQGNAPKMGTQGKKENKGSVVSSSDKLKASNFPATILKIGTWEYKSRYEGDLVAKCYFAKHKLVWEVLDGGLKNKIEIQWSDIVALKANYPDDGPGTLDVMLARQPLFFRETNPQPRKHTLWQATSDFTGGQASIYRQHYLQCPKGLLGKHFEKLVQCDPRLNFLSQQSEMPSESPYFETRISVFEDLRETNDEIDIDVKRNAPLSNFREATSTSGAQSSSSKSEMHVGGPREEILRETPSPSSVMDTHAIEEIRSNELKQLKRLNSWDLVNVPRLHQSISVSDLVSQIEHWISEKTSNNASFSNEEKGSLDVLDEIRRCLFSDSQQMSSDEKTLMSRVNSLCCLLQKDTAVSQTSNPKCNSYLDAADADRRTGELKTESGDIPACDQAPAMSRKDSVGDLLLSLPRIASLPHFLFNISEDSEGHAR